MATINFTGPDNRARGRNTWFVPATATLWTTNRTLPGATVVVDIQSKRPGKTAPIILYLDKLDAIALAHALFKEARS